MKDYLLCLYKNIEVLSLKHVIFFRNGFQAKLYGAEPFILGYHPNMIIGDSFWVGYQARSPFVQNLADNSFSVFFLGQTFCVLLPNLAG